MSLTGIVLAGGRSSRFGSDKLAEQVDGVPLLAAAIAAVAAIADGVIVAGPALPDGFEAADVPVAVIRDRGTSSGPLVALAHVLEEVGGSEDLALVVAGDMPRLNPAVLRAIVERLAGDRDSDAVHLGRHEPATDPASLEPLPRQVLPLAVRVQPASRAARDAVEAGQRSLQSLLDRMAVVELPLSVWLPLDPDALTVLDVDTRADLERLPRR